MPDIKALKISWIASKYSSNDCKSEWKCFNFQFSLILGTCRWEIIVFLLVMWHQKMPENFIY